MLYRADSDHDLTADEIDGNFRELRDDVDTLIAAGVGVSISEIDVVGDQMSIIMSDHSTQGPFTLPTAIYSDRGVWAPLTLYFVGDTFSINGTLYSVMFEHTSAATFDPGANDGGGHDFYHALFTEPANSLPAGGTDLMVLKKFGATDYVAVWGFVDVDEITGFDFVHPTAGQVATFDDGSGNWVNADLPSPGASSFSELAGTLGRAQYVGFLAVDDPGQSGALSFDRTTGDTFNVTTSGNITGISVADSDWFNAAYVNKLVLDIGNSGAFTFSDGGFINYWKGGSAPGSVSTRYRIIATTYDGGSTVWGEYETFA